MCGYSCVMHVFFAFSSLLSSGISAFERCLLTQRVWEISCRKIVFLLLVVKVLTNWRQSLVDSVLGMSVLSSSTARK